LTPSSIKIRRCCENERHGILDTCVLIDIEKIEVAALPDESYITTVSLAEPAAGPHAAQDRNERARRQDRLQSVKTPFESLPFDTSAARAS
jgi:predicted nucleic acid-binding protein